MLFITRHFSRIVHEKHTSPIADEIEILAEERLPQRTDDNITAMTAKEQLPQRIDGNETTMTAKERLPQRNDN
jgi:hypothetical protein